MTINSCASAKLEKRVGALEAGIYESKESNKRLVSQLSDLEKRLGEIDNSIFILKDAVDSTSEGLKEIKENLAGIKKAEIPSGVPIQPEPGFASLPAPVQKVAPEASEPEEADPFLFYRKAYGYFQAGEYETAKVKFSRFVALFPRHDLTDNALYWLGECYYSQKDFQSAIQTFEQVCRDFPGGNKVPDALLKLGYSYLAAGNQGQAREAIQKLTREFPHSEAANKAKEKLHF
ncbi:MAG: tol-pal system protein YbgF [Proteobacteria bacterium]|nr:tol-pal system protein YbgF [Pseudomonadota bacterium]